MTGYIIQNRAGAYLTKDLIWFAHDSISDAFVHPVTEIESIFEAAKSWDSKPSAVTHAMYSQDEGVTVKGKTISLDDDNLRAAMSFAETIAPIVEEMKKWQW